MTTLRDLRRVKDFAAEHRNLFKTDNALRWLIRKHAPDLTAKGALVRMDRRLLVDGEKLAAWLADRQNG
jgi:hypothetical protein